MKANTWEFARHEDGTYSVLHKGEALADCIPEKWLERTICEPWGFCGEECKHIVSELAKSGKCVLII